MKIFSIGEKIKYLRIYKGIKLKDLSNSNLSISKLSSIENNKIIPDDDTIRFLADKLGTTYEELSKNISDQIQDNIDRLNLENINNFNDYKNNLILAIDNKLYNVIFYICNKVFEKFVFCDTPYDLDDEILNIIPIYFDSVLNLNNNESKLIYNLDLARYFFNHGNYKNASYYFSLIRSISLDTDILGEYREIIILNELYCYLNLEEYDKIYEIREYIEKYINDQNMHIKYLNQFKYFYIVLIIRYDFEKFNKEIVDSLLDNCNIEEKLNYLYKISCILYNNGYFNETVNLCYHLYSYIDGTDLNLILNECRISIYLNHICNIFLENSNVSDLDKIINKSLNIAIRNKNIDIIFECYLIRIIVYIRRNDLKNLEIYLKLITSILDRVEYKTYHKYKILEVAFMIQSLGDVGRAVKYFLPILNKEEM